jgi:muramoyltetrapeptide carboxypeptidase
VIRPPALREGARVALVAPAGPLADGALEAAIERVAGWGWQPVVGVHAHRRHGFLAGTDAERLRRPERRAARRDVDAVWCLRGGYGTMRCCQHIDWRALAERPRALIGFSDNTALHLAIRRLGLVSFHGPHPATPRMTGFSETVLRAWSASRPRPGMLPFPAGGAPRAETVVGGAAEGPLVGGNLALLAATLGTPFAVRAAVRSSSSRTSASRPTAWTGC